MLKALNMPDTALQIYLPPFLLAFLLITFMWKWVRKIIRSKRYPEVEITVQYSRIKRIEVFYLLVFVVFAFMVSIYTFNHEHYYLFVPFDAFDHPFINGFGLLVLKIAFIAVVIAQIHIDKELYKYYRDMNDLKAMELVYYSERMLLGGLLLMFIGIFITLTNLISLITAVCSLLIYYKVFSFRVFRK